METSELIKELREICKCSFTIDWNDHKTIYQTVEDIYKEEDIEDFKNVEDYEKCCKNNEMWRVVIYSKTPVGFYTVYGSDLKEVLTRTLKEVKNE